jgi:hypothetical protein
VKQQSAAGLAADIATLYRSTEHAFTVKQFGLRTQLAVLVYPDHNAASFMFGDCVFCIESFYAKVHCHSST